MAKLWHKPSSRVQQSWATRCTMEWSRLLLKARYQGAWVLAIYNQITCNILSWRCLWQQPYQLKIARQEQAIVKLHPRLLLQHQRLQQILSTQPRRRLLQLWKMDLRPYFLKDGILLLGMVCIRISFLHHPRCSLMHQLLRR